MSKKRSIFDTILTWIAILLVIVLGTLLGLVTVVSSVILFPIALVLCFCIFFMSEVEEYD